MNPVAFRPSWLSRLLRKALLTAAVILAVGAYIWYADPTRAGRNEARADLRAGKLVLRVNAEHTEGHDDFVTLLRERYGVEAEVMAFPDSSETTAKFMAYNEVMQAAIARRFGPHAVEEAGSEAQRRAAARAVPR